MLRNTALEKELALRKEQKKFEALARQLQEFFYKSPNSETTKTLLTKLKKERTRLVKKYRDYKHLKILYISIQSKVEDYLNSNNKNKHP